MKVLGLMSGTSHDGIDAVLVEFHLVGRDVVAEIVTAIDVPYPDALRRSIIAALPPAKLDLGEVCRLDTEIGQAFAEAAAVAIGDERVDLICSHGQTVFHWIDESDGKASGTLQLGQASWIAERCGIPVLSDVRAADIAAGGQGAPLASTLDLLLLGDSAVPVAALNLGGIANATIVRPGLAPMSYDIGPANALIDAAMIRITGGTRVFDADGEYAARGSVRADLLQILLDEPFYRRRPPKSTGKELFNVDYLARALSRLSEAGAPTVDDDDLIATVTELSAAVIATELVDQCVERVLASGGGVDNPVLWKHLELHAPTIDWQTTDQLGVPPAAKEGLLMALIGWLTAHEMSGNEPECTGAAGPRMLGTLTAGPRRVTGLDRALISGRVSPPGRLRVLV